MIRGGTTSGRWEKVLVAVRTMGKGQRHKLNH
jgi:hypothetical protein